MNPRNLSPRDIGLACAALALSLDQGSKLLLLYTFHFIDMGPRDRVPVLPFFNLVMVWNPGVSYGLFPAHGPAGTAAIVVLTMALVAWLGWWLWGAQHKILTAGLGLVIGGALGNLVDRLIYAQVADFFHFYVHGFDWYVFNIADCAIALGVAALLYDLLLQPEPEAGETNG
jgi:signal peptidase II